MRVLNVKKTYRAKGVAVEALKGIRFMFLISARILS